MRNLIKVIGLVALLLWLMAGVVVAGELEVRVNHLNLSLTPEGNLLVTEQYSMVNPGEAFSGEGMPSFLLPTNAQDIHYGAGIDGEKAEIKDNKLTLYQEVPAGESTISFNYLLLGEAGMPHYFWDKEFNFDTPTFFVMSAAGELRVASTQLEDQGVMAMGNTQLNIYAGSFEQGETLSLTVLPDMMATENPGGNGAPGIIERNTAPPFHDPGHVRLWEQSPFSGFDAHLFLILVIGVPLGVLIWYLWKRRQGKDVKTDGQREEEVFQRLLLREKHLKQKLVELEEQRAGSELDEQNYQEQLEFYKQKLLEVRVKLKHFTE